MGIDSREPMAQRGVTDVLQEDHAAIRELCESLATVGSPEQRQYVMDEIERRFRAHTAVEDELLTEALLASEGAALTRLAESAAQADREATEVLREIAGMYPWARGYDQAVGRVVAHLLSHFAWEEESLFPQLAETIPDGRLRELGASAEQTVGRPPPPPAPRR